MGSMTAPTIQVGRVVSHRLTQTLRTDALVTGILGPGATPDLELRRWDQTTNVLLLVPLVKHKDNAVISEIAWDWLLPEEIAEMPSLAVGQSVAFFDAQMGYHEAVVIAKNDATTLPYLELLWWDVQAGQERREANVGHQDVVGVAVAHWRGLNE